MIVAMSSWLNASALAGAAAIQQHLAITVQNYTRDLDTANTNAIAAQGLLPDIQLASARFAKLADAERAGSLTGTAGSGTVVQLADADVGATRQPRAGSPGLRQARLGAVRTRRQASRQDARADLRSRTDLGAQRCLRHRIAGADGRDRQSAADLRGAGGEARRGVAVVGLHRAGRGRPHRRSRGSPDRRGRQGGKLDRERKRPRCRMPRTRFSRRRGSSRHGSSRCRRPKRCCAMPATSSRAGPARSRST